MRRGGWPLTEGRRRALRPPPAASRYKPVTPCTVPTFDVGEQLHIPAAKTPGAYLARTLYNG